MTRPLIILAAIATITVIVGLVAVHNFGTAPPPPKNCAILGPAPPPPAALTLRTGPDAAHGNVNPPVLRDITCPTPHAATIPAWATTSHIPTQP
jgi:hypothetical protein